MSIHSGQTQRFKTKDTRLIDSIIWGLFCITGTVFPVV